MTQNDRALFTSEVILSTRTDPETPPVGSFTLFPQSDGNLYMKNSNGDVYQVGNLPGSLSDVKTSGSSLPGQVAVWVDASTIEGFTSFLYDSENSRLSVPSSGAFYIGENPVLGLKNNRIELQSVGAVDLATAAAIKSSLNLSMTDISGNLPFNRVTVGGVPTGSLFLGDDGTWKAVPEVSFPPGAIMQYAGATAPEGWILCQGQALSTADYPSLFGVTGYTYGGVGATFNLPNLQQRVPVGAGAGYNRGATGGATTHTLTQSEMPYHAHTTAPHAHGVSDPGHTHQMFIWTGNASDNVNDSIGGRESAVSGEAGGSKGYQFTNGVGNQLLAHAGTGIGVQAAGVGVYPTGGNASHNNMQPFIVLNYIIKV